MTQEEINKLFQSGYKAGKHAGYMDGYTDGVTGKANKIYPNPNADKPLFCIDAHCDNFAENGVKYCANHAPYLKPSSDKKIETVGGIRI